MNKWKRKLTMCCLAASQVCYGARDCKTKAEFLVVAHLENSMVVPPLVLTRAEAVATGIFAGIGIELDWKEVTPRRARLSATCAAQPAWVVTIEFADRPTGRFPGDVMAFAVPGTRSLPVRIFYDRVSSSANRDLVPVLLGHVLAHEITHVLQGVARHSVEGVMKAQWKSQDNYQMLNHSLSFAEEDVQLVRANLSRLLPK